MIGVVVIACSMSWNGPVSARKAWGGSEEQGAYQSLRLFDKNGMSCGTGRYVLQHSPDGMLSAEMDLLIEGNERIRQRVEMTNRGRFHPVSYRHEHVRPDKAQSFEVDFASGRVACRSRANGRVEELETVVRIDPERTFAGLMFVLLALHFPEAQTEMDIFTILFDSEPQVLKVTLRRVFQGEISLGSRNLTAVKYAIQPKLPGLVSLLMGSHFDNHVWVSASEPATFLRFEGSLAPGGPFFRIE
jgi:hypothetical protein